MSLFTPTSAKRLVFFVVFDFLLSFLSLYFAYNLRFNFDVLESFWANFFYVFIILALLKIISLYIFKVYSIIWAYFSIDGLEKIIKAHLLAYFIFIVIFYTFYHFFAPFARAILIIDFILSIVFLGSFRISKRYFWLKLPKNYSLAVVFASKKNANLIIRDLQGKNIKVVAIFDFDKKNYQQYILDIRINPLNNLPDLLQTHPIKTAIISKDFTSEQMSKIVEILQEHSVDIKIYETLGFLKELSIYDLLARNPKDLDKSAILNYVSQKTVLITGAGGSIGQELVRKCIEYGAKKLVLVDFCELNIYNLMNNFTQTNVQCILQDITDYEKMDEIFSKFCPQIVLHAAAYKHVFIVENNIDQAVHNNIYGTKIIVDLSIKYKVQSMVFISTDKAVRPTNVMGATKRICELYLQNVKSGSTKLVSVRFGNVLGSSGSVVPKFKEQIEKKQALSVTHPEVTRFFMLTQEACALVLQAASLGENQEVFVLDMGKPVKILDLAKKMLSLTNSQELGINFIGLKKGEKLYEELLIDENDKSTKYQSIFIAQKTAYDFELLNAQLQELFDTKDKLEMIKKIVKEFNHATN